MSIKYQEHDAQLGITTKVHETESKVVIEKSYDATPFVEAAAAMRAATADQRWGEMRHVGFIPMAELATMLRQDGGFDVKRVRAWLKERPALTTYDKFNKS